jgi:hypothetical protein
VGLPGTVLMDKREEENQPCGMQVSCGDGDSTKGTQDWKFEAPSPALAF